MPHSSSSASTAPRSARRGPRRDSARGQAFVFLLPLVAALAAAFLFVFDAGQATSEKRRLVDATDAAALGAATWQARALNFEAYMNRAVIANEAAIAQSVSLRSWSACMNRMLPGAAALTRVVPLLNAATLALERIWAAFDAALQPGLSVFEGMLSLVDHDLAAAQRLVHAAGFVAVPETVRATLAANDPRYRVSDGGELLLGEWLAEWARFTSFYGGAFRWRQADVLRRSLDGFSESRGATLSAPLLGAVVRAEKRGGTDLLDFETWRALDTLALHTRTGLIFGRFRETLPLGWGGAENGAFTRLVGVHGGSQRTNPRTSRFALATLRPQRAYLGLPSLRDVSVPQRGELEPPQVVVRARLDARGLATSARTLGGPSVVDLRGRAWRAGAGLGPAVFALAAAEVRFVRLEPRADGAAELGSLFNPYWRARLVEPATAARVAAAAADGTPGALEVLP